MMSESIHLMTLYCEDYEAKSEIDSLFENEEIDSFDYKDEISSLAKDYDAVILYFLFDDSDGSFFYYVANNHGNTIRLNDVPSYFDGVISEDNEYEFETFFVSDEIINKAEEFMTTNDCSREDFFDYKVFDFFAQLKEDYFEEKGLNSPSVLKELYYIED
jgi:hypothetical protein